MKRIVALLTLCCSLSVFALSALPNGKWEGDGRFRGEKGDVGTYKESLTVKDNIMTNEMTFGPQKVTYVMKLDFKPNDFVAVTIVDKQSGQTYGGSGYCGSIWCHVQADHSNKFEMTIVFNGAQVYELGSDVENGNRGWFESSLKSSP